jgi:hypothetical protein
MLIRLGAGLNSVSIDPRSLTASELTPFTCTASEEPSPTSSSPPNEDCPCPFSRSAPLYVRILHLGLLRAHPFPLDRPERDLVPLSWVMSNSTSDGAGLAGSK